MEKMVVVVFDSKTKAFEGLEILRDLDDKAEISLYEAQVVKREPDGAIRVIDIDKKSGFPGVAGATAVGALVGILGGIAGMVLGGSIGALAGYIREADEAGVTDEFVGDVAKALTPGKVAVVAYLAEDWVTPLDTGMERIGGVVFRRIRTTAEATQEDRDAAAHRAEMEQLKAERAKIRVDRLSVFDAKIDHARAKLEAAIERKRVKMRLRQQQREAKIQALQAKADKAEGEIRRRQEARIAELRSDYAKKAVQS